MNSPTKGHPSQPSQIGPHMALDFALVSAIIVFAVNQLKGAFGRVLQEVQIALDLLTKERVQLEERIQERTEELETKTAQLRSSTTVARIVAEIQSIGELMEAATKLTIRAIWLLSRWVIPVG
ncbi:MAG: hypothetical protein IPN58_16060 [Anaerolineales bacterium]|nr:hypothetical protein [Anaerolineales bacterium]